MGLDASEIDLELRLLMRLVVAVVLTGLLGWEREAVGKSAGLRTHILVGVGAVLFVGLVEFIVLHFQMYGEQLRFDPTRVLEAAATAVAFLGAGLIVFSRGEGQVHGLTTAASIWSTAAVAMAVGLGRYLLAMGATALLLLVLRGLLFFENRGSSRERRKEDADAARDDGRSASGGTTPKHPSPSSRGQTDQS